MDRMRMCPLRARFLIDALKLTDYMKDYYSFQVIGLWKRKGRLISI